MAEEKKIELEREYVIPLRRKIRKVPRYKRANKAIKTIKQFLARHMKVEERDTRKIKIDKYLNNEIWFRGIKNPPGKIKVKARKENGIVYVELAEIPEKVKWDMEREKKAKGKEHKVEEKKVDEKTEEQKKEEQEKEKATQEAGAKEQKQEAKKEKHTSKPKQSKQKQIHRMTMQK